MAEKSYLWTTGGAGDGSATYSRADWSKIVQIVAACLAQIGIAPNALNACAGSIPAANTVRVASGMAIVDGISYISDANVDVAIPSAVGGGNTRIDRVVLRANWTAQTVRVTRIAGTDAATPTAPALTQTSGTTYDVPLFQVTVNTSGTVTITTDERLMARVQTNGITDANITAAKLATDAVETAKIKDANVTAVKLATDAVETAKIKDANVTLAKLAADSVDDTKAGNRIAQFYRRQGGSSSNWITSGTTTYTPTAVRAQMGIAYLATTGTETITFPVAFSNAPIVLACAYNPSQPMVVSVSNVLATEFSITRHNLSGSQMAGAVTWIAIGPE